MPQIVLGVWLGMMAFLSVCCAVIHYFRLYTIERTRLSSDIFRRWYLLTVIIIGAGSFIPSHYSRVLSAFGVIFQQKFNYT